MTSLENRQASTQLRAGARANAIPSALYVKIKDHLRTRILDGRLKPHDQLPSESALIEQFDVSRITVRQALNDLQKEGLIFKLHGKGSFVSNPKADQRLASLQGFAEAMSAAGHEIYNRLAGLRDVPAQATVADRLQVAPRSRVTEIKRVRFLNRSPISFEVTYLPAEIGARLAKADLETRDIFLILENDFGIRLGNADLMIEAGLADARVARHLRIERDAPVLQIERLTHTADRRPLDFEYLFFRGDAFRYRLSIERKQRMNANRGL
jgi:GntR family transcriptional regulator